MLRLGNRLVSTIRAGAAFPVAASSLLRRRVLCTDISPAQFVSESDLISICGITPSQGPKASRDRADAVHAFLASELGHSEFDVASTVARSAQRLCCDVDKTLALSVSQLRGIGLSTPEIARLLRLVPSVFVRPERVSRVAFYMSLLGSFDKVHATIRKHTGLLGISTKDVLKPNIAFLLQCGLTARDIARVLFMIPRLVAGSKERVEDAILCAEQLGVSRGTPMFPYALVAAYSVRREAVVAKTELLRSLGLSSGQVAIAVAKMPSILCGSEDRLRRAMDFLTKEAGVDMETIARGPAMLKFSIEGRLAPRLKVLKLLEEKGLSAGKCSFYNVACMSEERFLQKFVRLHEDSVPAVIAVYAAARPGKALSRSG